MTKFEIINEEKIRRAILVGLLTDQDPNAFEDSMQELFKLAKACGIKPEVMESQKLPSPVQSTYIGSGKLEEIKQDIEYFDADLVIFNQMLSPTQFRNLGKILNVEIMDRTGLILRIFSDQAKTKEARLQVEYANLKYLLPRLAGMWSHLGRQAGASGSRSSRGEGEKQIELDRRYIEKKIVEVEKELKKIERERITQREKRTVSDIPLVALVGYTNAGKSTIMNSLLDMNDDNGTRNKKVLEQDKLFATLDTTVRSIKVKGYRRFLLSDTVGFINDLPAILVKGFRSTLEEVLKADLLLQVVDYSDPEFRSRIEVTNSTLKDIGAGNIPMIYVYNKSDLIKPYPNSGQDDYDNTWCDQKFNFSDISIPFAKDDSIYISAKQKKGLDELLKLIENALFGDCVLSELLIPYDKGEVLSGLIEKLNVEETDYTEEGVRIKAYLGPKDIERYKEYVHASMSR